MKEQSHWCSKSKHNGQVLLENTLAMHERLWLHRETGQVLLTWTGTGFLGNSSRQHPAIIATANLICLTEHSAQWLIDNLALEELRRWGGGVCQLLWEVSASLLQVLMTCVMHPHQLIPSSPSSKLMMNREILEKPWDLDYYTGGTAFWICGLVKRMCLCVSQFPQLENEDNSIHLLMTLDWDFRKIAHIEVPGIQPGTQKNHSAGMRSFHLACLCHWPWAEEQKSVFAKTQFRDDKVRWLLISPQIVYLRASCYLSSLLLSKIYFLELSETVSLKTHQEVSNGLWTHSFESKVLFCLLPLTE